jgi:hypothetical protein
VPGLSFRFDATFGYDSGEWTGDVIRAFSSAALAQERGGERLMTLADMASSLVPWGVILPLGFPLPRPGDVVVLTGRRLSLSGAAGSALRLTGPGIELTLQPRELSLPALGAHVEVVPRATPAGGQVAELLTARVSKATRDIVAVLCGAGEGDLRAPVRSLVGLGSGSTPTGDDVLVGLTAAAIRFATDGGFAPAGVDALRRELARISAGSTTDVAREMIVHSSRGAFPEDLIHFVELLGAPGRPTSAVGRAARALARVGGRSGTDMLAGTLAAARALLAGGGRARR